MNNKKNNTINGQKNNTIIATFLKDKNVASIAPTTRKNVSRICKSMDFDRDIVVVEYGPGDGVFTKYLLSLMSGNSRLIVVEQNEGFANSINGLNDSRMKVFNDRAENIKKISNQESPDGVDYVISGIPLAFLKLPQREKLIIDTYDILKSNGIFFVYQFTRISRRLLQKHFDSVSTRFLPFNIPPLFLFQAVKNEAVVHGNCPAAVS